MAKSIRSKAKRKLRAAKREKFAAKERVKLLAIREQEEGVKMAQEPTGSGEMGENIPALSAAAGDGDEAMEVASLENQTALKPKKKKMKKSKPGAGKNLKRLRKKRRNKYKW